MYTNRLDEISRCHYIFRENYHSYAIPLYKNHFKQGSIDHYNPNKLAIWDDATLMGDYLDYVLERIKKYGLHWGALTVIKHDNYKNLMKKDEDDLTDFFLHQMRQAPMERKEREKMTY